jgi:hypothetical protein
MAGPVGPDGGGTLGVRVLGVTLANAPTAAPLQNAGGGGGEDGHAVSVALVRMQLCGRGRKVATRLSIWVQKNLFGINTHAYRKK